MAFIVLIGWRAAWAYDDPPHESFLAGPVWIYDNWSAYDELSDSVPLTEELAMRELDEMLRLRRAGIRLDYYLMDAFWYAPDGGYRTWRAESWPHGPDRWLEACKANGITPGLWFSTNTLTHMNPARKWRSSLSESGYAMSLYYGGFLADFMEVLQHWYDRGVRLFKFDFADFDAAPPAAEKTQTAEEIRRRNVQAFRNALQEFRAHNPDVVLLAFNGFGGELQSTAAPFPFDDAVDPDWLQVFDALYAGDPRPADVPQMDFWRAVDIYSDHMVRRFEQSGVSLQRIDSASFMIGDTGTNYRRRTNAWQGMLLLMLARGGWVDTVHGNLEFLDDAQIRWFAQVQALYDRLQRFGTTKSFGAIPGEGRPYGFGSAGSQGALYTVVNPAQGIRTIRLPRLSSEQTRFSGGRVLFRDAGFEPVLDHRSIRLGPGQMALLGFGQYAGAGYDLGIQSDIRIPAQITALDAAFAKDGSSGAIAADIAPPDAGDLRIVMQQRYPDGSVIRSSGNSAPTARSMGEVFVITASQEGKKLPVDIRYDKVVWSGLSWAAGEIRHADIASGRPVHVRLSSSEGAFPLVLEGRLYQVQY